MPYWEGPVDSCTINNRGLVLVVHKIASLFGCGRTHRRGGVSSRVGEHVFRRAVSSAGAHPRPLPLPPSPYCQTRYVIYINSLRCRRQRAPSTSLSCMAAAMPRRGAARARTRVARRD